MARVFVQDTELQDIADAIREKNGSEDTYRPSEMGNAVRELSSSEEFVGIKFSEFDSYRQKPKVVDLRNLPPLTVAKSMLHGGYDNLLSSVNKNGNGGFFNFIEEVYMADGYEVISAFMFKNTSLKKIHADLSGIKIISANAFENCEQYEIPYMPLLDTIGNHAFAGCKKITNFKLYVKASFMNNGCLGGCDNLLDIYVPWSEGEVANAPWGAINATIHYNTVYDDNHNPIAEGA